MKKYDVAAYIWPAYTSDEIRTRMFWQEGNGEWQSVKNAEENSRQFKPEWYETWKMRKPLWGYLNEADPEVMEKHIDCAVNHGVNVFIYDWYWYDGRPFLENCLNDGFLKAKNASKMKFYLMWANHDVPQVWNIELSDDIGWKDTIWRGFVDEEEFRTLVDRWIGYFKHPSYYKIDGKPVFMIYDVANYIKGFNGDVKAAKAALEYFNAKAQEAGFPGIHCQIVLYSLDAKDYSGVDGKTGDVSEIYKQMNLDSASHYQWVAFQEPTDYTAMTERALTEYKKIDETEIVYFPHVSVGWDNNPRFKRYRSDVAYNNTPDNFEKALRNAKEYVDSHDLPAPLITINSWNEWTETSYLLPDELNGYGYLEAIKKVFVDDD